MRPRIVRSPAVRFNSDSDRQPSKRDPALLVISRHSFLPGWVFNVATIFHGEGALLAVLFLFTVHFFNNHFRPDKFLEVVMFTGAMPLEQFKQEHRVEHNRLLAAGELEKHLVDAPSRPMSVGATILGFTLLGIGLLLLAFVLSGMFGIGS
jgi:hypothetical protein